MNEEMMKVCEETTTPQSPTVTAPLTQGSLEGGEMAVSRTPEVVAAEIRALTANMLTSIVEIGRRMCEAKEMLPHGSFGNWIKENTGYSVSTANNFMRLFNEYADKQLTLFGAEVNCQTFGNLTYSKALALLALPENEREDFVKENKVDEMSVRELEAAIKERDEAKAALSESEAARDEISASYREALSQIEELRSRPVDVAVTESDPEAVKKAVEEALSQAAEKHKTEMDALMKKLEKETKKTDKLEKALSDAEEKVQQAADASSDEAEEYKKDAERAKAEAEKLRKELLMADPVTAEFKGLFEEASGVCAKLIAMANGASEETGAKLKAALRALGGKLSEI